MSTSVPALNTDVLLQIMAAAPREDRARFMAVSRSLYAHGPAYILKEAPCLRDERQLASFLSFLSVQPPNRHKLVRHLKLSFQSQVSSPVYLRLMEALSLMSNLQSLALSNETSGGLYHWWSPNLVPDFNAAHPSPPENDWEVSDSGTDNLPLGLLTSLRCELTHLVVEFPTRYQDTHRDRLRIDEWPVLHPVVWLVQFTSSLEELSLTISCTLPTISPSPEIIYPRMHTFDLKSTTLPLTLPFIRAYPNLERLAFQFVSSQYGGPDPHLWDTWRAENMHQQQRAGLAWERLRAFDGALPALYALGLTRSIERVALSHVHSSQGHMLGPVLACARPRVLTLEGWPGVVRAPQGENTFAALQGAGAARLEDLTIEARLGDEHLQVDLGVALDDLLDALAGAPLRQFTLRIYTENIEPPGGLYAYDALANLPLGTVERAARDLDVVEFLGRLMAAIPTLGAAVVSVQGPCNPHRMRTARFADGRISFEDSAVLPVRRRGKGVR